MNRRITSLVSIGLTTAFLTFSVGVPVVKYLCPMMQTSDEGCEMSRHSDGSTSSVEAAVPPCCAPTILAERSTTPYLAAHHTFELKSGTISGAVLAPSYLTFAHEPVAAIAGSPPLSSSNPPLFILNSTYLI